MAGEREKVVAKVVERLSINAGYERIVLLHAIVAKKMASGAEWPTVDERALANRADRVADVVERLIAADVGVDADRKSKIEALAIEKLESGKDPEWETADKQGRSWVSKGLKAWLTIWTIEQIEADEAAEVAAKSHAELVELFGPESGWDDLAPRIGYDTRGRRLVVSIGSELDYAFEDALSGDVGSLKKVKEYALTLDPRLVPFIRKLDNDGGKRFYPIKYRTEEDRDDTFLYLACLYTHKINDLFIDKLGKKSRQARADGRIHLSSDMGHRPGPHQS